MKKKSYFLIALLGLASCNKNNGKLELVLLNNKVICVKNAVENVNDSIYNKLSKNILSYKLVNNSSQSYFMILNEDMVDAMENDSIFGELEKNRVGKYNGISFNLYKNRMLLTGRTTLTTGGDVITERSLFVSKARMDSVFLAEAKKVGRFTNGAPTLYNKNVYEHGFIIHPGEVKYFTSLVNLPIRKGQTAWRTFVHSPEPDSASLSLVSVAKKYRQFLSKNQLKDIKENGCVLFDGTLQSNGVPVKMVSMSF